jgi:hypothetical protein
MDDLPIPQFATILFGLLILYEEVRIYKVNHGEWKRAFNVVLWGLHLLIFYWAQYLDGSGVLNLHDIHPKIFTTWSPYLRLHSAVVMYLVIRSSRTFVSLSKKYSDTKDQILEQSENTNDIIR